MSVLNLKWLLLLLTKYYIIFSLLSWMVKLSVAKWSKCIQPIWRLIRKTSVYAKFRISLWVSVTFYSKCLALTMKYAAGMFEVITTARLCSSSWIRWLLPYIRLHHEYPFVHCVIFSFPLSLPQTWRVPMLPVFGRIRFAHLLLFLCTC